MSQKATGGRNNKLVGRDDNSITNMRIDVLSFRGISLTITRLCKWARSSHRKSVLIVRLQNRITRMRQEIESLKRDHKREIEKLNNDLGNKIEEILEAKKQTEKAKDVVDLVCQEVFQADTKEALLTDKTYAELNRIRQVFANLKEDNKGCEPYMRVALWMRHQNISNWAEECYLEIAHKEPNLIPENLKGEFCKDICNYLDWLQESLLYAKPLRKSLGNLNNSRSVYTSIPHREAFQYIKRKYHQSLSDNEKLSLRQMIDFLCDHLDVFFE